MEKEALRQIQKIYGSRATDSPYECSHYARDLAPFPGFLIRPFFNAVPDLVVRPVNAEEISETLKIAYAHDIPVTPRAGASTVYFNCVPSRGGIVMDLNLIKGVVKHDVTARTATVKAGTTWSELDEYLNPKGLSSKSFPSSAPAATVGGWFCMMGYGIGSLKYGSLLSQVKELEVVMPTGEIRRLRRGSDPSPDWFSSSEGTLGIVTEIELEVRKLESMKHFLLQLPNLSELTRVLSVVKDSTPSPYNLHFADPLCLATLHRLGFSPAGTDAGFLLSIDYEGAMEELIKSEKSIAALARNNPRVQMLPAETAETEWAEKFMAMRLKRGGPSILGAEVWLPVGELEGYLADIQKMGKKYHLEMFSYGHIVTPEHGTVMSMFFSDENRILAYVLNLSLLKKIHDLGDRHRGYPYGVGLWNTPYIERIFPPLRLAELRKRKEKLDPKGLMNPGKVYRWPRAMNPLCFGAAMKIMAGIGRLTRRDQGR